MTEVDAILRELCLVTEALREELAAGNLPPDLVAYTSGVRHQFKLYLRIRSYLEGLNK